jgi:hypothetical protein
MIEPDVLSEQYVASMAREPLPMYRGQILAIAGPPSGAVTVCGLPPFTPDECTLVRRYLCDRLPSTLHVNVVKAYGLREVIQAFLTHVPS